MNRRRFIGDSVAASAVLLGAVGWGWLSKDPVAGGGPGVTPPAEHDRVLPAGTPAPPPREDDHIRADGDMVAPHRPTPATATTTSLPEPTTAVPKEHDIVPAPGRMRAPVHPPAHTKRSHP